MTRAIRRRTNSSKPGRPHCLGKQMQSLADQQYFAGFRSPRSRLIGIASSIDGLNS
jgi:hypothetical protein